MNDWEQEFFERFGANKIWVSPSRENVETIHAIWAFFQSTLSLHDKKLAEKVRGMRKEKPKTKCLNAENHLFGKCFECEKNNGFNQALELAAQVIEEKEGV